MTRLCKECLWNGQLTLRLVLWLMLTSLLPSKVLACGSPLAVGEEELTEENGVVYKNGCIVVGVKDRSREGYELREGTRTLAPFAFKDCRNMRILRLPVSIERIGNFAFENCSTLSSIELPAELKEIGASAFYKCVSLAEVAIPSGVQALEDETFFHCSSLEKVSLPKGLRRIGEFAFCGCLSLKAIALPENVSDIGDAAFSDCQSLQHIFPRAWKLFSILHSKIAGAWKAFRCQTG